MFLDEIHHSATEGQGENGVAQKGENHMERMPKTF
jgi:hypothetical protein